MNWQDFSGKKIALLGAGIENIALIPHLIRAKAEVAICNREETPATDKLKQDGHKLIIGENYLDGLDYYDYVFRIAGMPTATLESAIRDLAKKPIITSPTDLFLSLRPCHIIGVTGTKGKGTTSTFIGSILKAAGKQVFVIGNIGRPIFEIYDELTQDSYAVVELSSFQLEDVHSSPEIAVVLPITEDHLQPVSVANPNFHPSIEHYRAAKANITAYQEATDLLVYAADSEATANIAEGSGARKIGVGTKSGDLLVSELGALSSDGKTLIDLKQVGLRGEHIFLNAGVAIAVAREIGCNEVNIEQGLIDFRPLPHRMEKFAVHDGRTFVDDSYATNPTAAMAALTAFTEPVILLAGGINNDVDFKIFAERVTKSSVKAVVLIGREADKIKHDLETANFSGSIIMSDTFEEAVKNAVANSSAGDVVLLSPACKSFDMFKNATERGNEFQRLVTNLYANS